MPCTSRGMGRGIPLRQLPDSESRKFELVRIRIAYTYSRYLLKKQFGYNSVHISLHIESLHCGPLPAGRRFSVSSLHYLGYFLSCSHDPPSQAGVSHSSDSFVIHVASLMAYRARVCPLTLPNVLEGAPTQQHRRKLPIRMANICCKKSTLWRDNRRIKS